MTTHDVENDTDTGIQTAGVLTDPRFFELLRLFQDRAVTRSEFDALQMPAGADHDAVWNLIRDIRKTQGVVYGDPSTFDGAPLTQWFTPTRSIEVMLRDLADRTRTGCALDVALRERSGRHLVIEPLVQEIVSAIQCESLSIDAADVRRVALEGREPQSIAEHLARNTYRILTQGLESGRAADASSERGISRASIDQLYARLTEGIDRQSFSTSIPWGLEWPEDHLGRDTLLDQIVELAAGRMADPAEHPIVLAQRLICKFWKNQPFENCNYLMGSLVANHYLRLAGYPVFTYVPSSTLTLAWRDGSFSDDTVAPYASCGDTRIDDRDWTLYWESNLRILQIDLDGFERHVLGVKVAEDALVAAVRADRNLNHRQAEILVRAIVQPETVFKIADHQKAYDLAYSTARLDLTTLADRDLLSSDYQGKTQVFRAAADLAEKLDRHYRER